MSALRTSTVGLLAAGVGAAAWATFVEPRAFTLRRYAVPVLPEGAHPLRVLHLSDVHLVPGQRAKAAWVSSLADLQPDLVVHTGDSLAHPGAIAEVLDAYDDLLDLPGVFVLGSNDYYPPTAKNPLRYLGDGHRKGAELTNQRLDTARLVEGLTSRGWVDLDNARATMTVRGVPLDLVGVDDPHLDLDRHPDRTAPRDSGALTVGVTHAPYQRVLDRMTSDGARLVLAGHTHGGQLRVPVLGALVTNCDLDRRRARGLSRWWPGAGSTPSEQAPEAAAYLHVSAGLGGSPYTPFRFACRPEATLLTLT